MAATIDIIGKSGVKHSAVFEEESVRKFELMKEDYVRLVFSTKEQFAVSLGDYIEIGSGFNAALGGRFEITKPQRPTFNTQTGGYDYDLQFDAPHYKWNNKLFKFEPSTKRNEASWSLTDNLQNHMAVFLRNLEYYGWEYTVDPASYQMASASRVIFIQYNNKYLLDALTQIAEAFECEWWITDNVIHLGKAESGSAIDFTIGQNVESMGSEKGEQEYITRLYGFGSTRNLPPDYRQNDEQVLLNGVVQKRVMLPVATPYVDIAEGLSDDEVVEGIVVFDDVYPQLDCYVTDVHTDMREVKDEDSDDEEATITVPIYRFKDSSLLFSKEYILPGQQLQVQFQSGRLNGMIFDLAFNPDDVAEDSENGQWFEIVRNETYGLFLPNDTLMPAVNDSFVLLGWNVKKLESGLGLITAAENKVLARTREYAAKLQIDPNVYPCKMMADYMYGLRGTHQDSTATKVGTFYLGQRIRLNNTNFFEGGSRLSRVVGYEYKLDKPYDGATIYVGESATYSSRKATQDAINEVSETITYKGGNYSGSGSSGGGSVYIITTNDDSTPTDANVYSALRTERQFARKDRDDAISSLWTFNHGYGAKRGIQTKDYKDYGDANEENLFGKGFELIEKGDGNGGTKTRMEVDELFVRIKAFFAQLEIREMSYVGGNYAFSSAGSKIYFVEWLDALGNRLPKVAGNVGSIYTFRCYLYSDDGTTATMNKWASDDQALCETFNIDSGVHQNTSNKRYWRRVTGIGKGVIQDSGDTTQYQYVDISMTDCETGSAYPEAEDTIVQLGNWSNASRQGVIYLKVEGSGSPAIMEYSGVGANGQHFVLPAPTLLLSPSKNVIYGEFHSVVDEGGGGNTGAGETIEDQLRALIERLNDIQNQADKKFDIWFGTGVPLPSADNPTATANYPASEWTTEALKALHSQDIYYNTNREPASTGGRAWRWIAVESNGTVTYWWDEILDADTLAALEKIADVASDGIITGGAEKTRVYIDWMKALREYYEYKERAEDYEITDEWTAYRTAFLNLGKMLNNNVAMVPNPDGSYNTPAWLTDLLSETTIPSPVTYRQRWNDYYAALAVLLQTITKKAKELADAAQETADEAIQTLTEYASDGYLTPDEKLTVKREFIAAFHEMNDSTENGRPAGILDQASDGNNGYIIAAAIVNLYINAYKSVGQYLNGGNTWNIPNTEEIADAALPSWLQAANMTRTENITTDSARASWLSVWENFYSARTAVLTALTEKAQDTADGAQETADGAHDRIDDIVSDGVISAGSEKSLLYINWLKTIDEYNKYIAQAADYFGANHAKATALTTAYKKLAAMLDGQDPATQYANVSANILNGTTRPTWLTAANINVNTILSETTINGVAGTPDAYRDVWKGYHMALTDLLEAITKKAKELADAAQADATEALSKLEDITADGKLTLDELPLLRREFEAAYRERAEMTDLATNDSSHKLIDAVLRPFLDAYLASFKNLAYYLQMGNRLDWAEPASYSVNNGSGVSDEDATYIVTVKNPLAATDFPLMLRITDVVTFQSDWHNPTAAGDSGAKFRDLWADLTAKQVALANAMATLAKTNADNAQVTADDAQNKIADIVDDGIISGGSEKSQLYKEWMLTKEEYFDYHARAVGYGFNGFNSQPSSSKEYVYYQDYLAFEQAFDALVLMLNGGTYGGGQTEVDKDYTNRTVLLANGSQLEWLRDLQSDTTISEYSYTVNNIEIAYSASAYRQLWNNYYYASVKLLNDFTEYSKALADEALHLLGEITDDGKITPSEKNTIRLNWREVVSEFPLLHAMVSAYITSYSNKGDSTTANTLTTKRTNYVTYFEALAKILNGGTNYAYSLSPANFPTPSWIGTGMNDTETLDATAKTNFNNAWANYYDSRTQLQDAITDAAKKPGDEALGELSNLAADDILTPFEKLTVLRDWDAVNAEYEKLTAQADKTHVGYSAYTEAYYRLGNYLYDLTDTATDRHIPLSTMNGSYLKSDGNTTISGSTFKAKWSNYYKERSDLVAALATSHVSYFVGANVPSAPYYVGDLWLKLSSGATNSSSNVEANGQMMVCVNDCTTAGQETEQDWANLKDITEKRDPRLLLAALVNMVYNYVGGYIREKSSNQYMNIYVGEKPSSAHAEGDLAFDGTNLWKYSDTWDSITNESLRMAFKAVYDLTGIYTIRIFKYRPSFTAKLYDIVCSQITFTDNQAPSGYQTIEGGIQIQMYNGSDWEVLQESTRSVLENLPGYVRAVAIASANGVVNSSGFLTSSDWATLFSQATDADGNILAQAHLGTFVTKVSDGNGGYKIQSGVRIEGDQIIVRSGDAISLAITNAVSDLKGYGPNLLPNSIINETSNAYGFGTRSLQLEAGKTYTLSAKGIVPTSLPSNMVLKVYIYRRKDSSEASTTSQIGQEWAISRDLTITANGGAARVGSCQIVADKTATYYITSYLYDTNQQGDGGNGNSGTRTYPVTVQWYKVEEGGTATPWVPSDADGKRYENYIVNPLAVTGTKYDDECTGYTQVDDAVFGKVMQVSHRIDGHWQLTFTRRSSYGNLTNDYATFFVICREANGNSENYTYNSENVLVRKKLRFGDANKVNIIDTTTSQFVDLGNGWRKYYATVKMTSALASTVGICHVMGTWQIYSVGIVLGGICPLVEEIMANNALLTTGINITTGEIELRADKVKFTSSDGSVSGKIWINPTTGALNATDANLSGKFTSENTTTKNKILIDAQSGYFKMMGPSAVDDENHNIPADPTTSVIDLFKVQFETDPDTLSRVAVMNLYGRGSSLSLDPIDGIWFNNGEDNVLVGYHEAKFLNELRNGNVSLGYQYSSGFTIGGGFFVIMNSNLTLPYVSGIEGHQYLLIFNSSSRVISKASNTKLYVDGTEQSSVTIPKNSLALVNSYIGNEGDYVWDLVYIS